MLNPISGCPIFERSHSFQIPQKISRFEPAACEVSSWVIWDWSHMSCWLQGALWKSRKCLGGENWSFGVEMTPKAVGCWGTVPRHTLTRYIKIQNQVFNRDNMHKMCIGIYTVTTLTTLKSVWRRTQIQFAELMGELSNPCTLGRRNLQVHKCPPQATELTQSQLVR